MEVEKNCALVQENSTRIMEQKLWVWICSTLVLVTICNCASRQVQSSVKCVFFNDTLCETSNGLKGCGDHTQECQSVENDKRSYCYAVWINNTITKTLTPKLKVILYWFV